MTFEDLKEFNGQAVTEEQLEEIEDCELVANMENYGTSPMYPELEWYIITLVNGMEINVFV